MRLALPETRRAAFHGHDPHCPPCLGPGTPPLLLLFAAEAYNASHACSTPSARAARCDRICSLLRHLCIAGDYRRRPGCAGVTAAANLAIAGSPVRARWEFSLQLGKMECERS